MPQALVTDIPEQKTHQTEANDYTVFARDLVDTCIISDPWVDGMERFRLDPLVLTQERWQQFQDAAEAFGRIHQELCEIIIREPRYLDEFYNLTPYQKLMWLASRGHWHGISRLDMFGLPDGGIQICEMNSDTPSGEPEATVLNEVRRRFHPDLHDPNADFENRFINMVMQTYRTVTGKTDTSPTVAIIYPTDLPEELSMIELYRVWFDKRGSTVVLGSPYNITRDANGDIYLLGEKIDLIIRHYKTDWWGERLPVWNDEPEYDDPDPLDIPLRHLLDAEAEGNIAIVNPFGAVITQNKLSMAFCWQHIDLFSDAAQNAIRSYLPESRRLCDVDRKTLKQDEWVLKSDFGCEGDEVVIGKFSTPEQWQRALDLAIPEHWIIQRYFEAERLEGDMIPNYGLFLIGGRASGIFTRLSQQATNYLAVTVPTFVEGVDS